MRDQHPSHLCARCSAVSRTAMPGIERRRWSDEFEGPWGLESRENAIGSCSELDGGHTAAISPCQLGGGAAAVGGGGGQRAAACIAAASSLPSMSITALYGCHR